MYWGSFKTKIIIYNAEGYGKESGAMSFSGSLRLSFVVKNAPTNASPMPAEAFTVWYKNISNSQDKRNRIFKISKLWWGGSFRTKCKPSMISPWSQPHNCWFPMNCWESIWYDMKERIWMDICRCVDALAFVGTSNAIPVTRRKSKRWLRGKGSKVHYHTPI